MNNLRFNWSSIFRFSQENQINDWYKRHYYPKGKNEETKSILFNE
jgi:hypothetical protein